MAAGARRLRAFARDGEGASAVEFALLVPILCVIFAVMVDFGFLLFTRFNINENVSSATNYALVRADSVSAASGATLAGQIAGIIPANVDVTVVVNNGPQVVRTNGTPVASGTASNAELCYCPSLSGSAISWGSAQSCGSACTGGGVAGKFVLVAATSAYSPMLGWAGIQLPSQLAVRSLVQVK